MGVVQIYLIYYKTYYVISLIDCIVSLENDLEISKTSYQNSFVEVRHIFMPRTIID